jgi:hypothetical protein
MIALTLHAATPSVALLLLGLCVVGIVWAPIIAAMIASGASAGASAYSAKKDRDQALANANANRALTEDQFTKDLAFRESMANPFRQQRSQVTTLAGLDMLEGMDRQSGPAIGDVPYARPDLAQGIPKLTPETLMAIAAARQSIMAGRTAPSQTYAGNNGRTATMDLYGVGSGRLNPTLDEAFSNGPISRRAGQRRRKDDLDGF